MTCNDKQAAHLLQRSFLGELDPAGHEALRAHLASCVECRERYDRQVALERLLEPGSGPLPSAHLDLLGQAVLARVQAQAAPARPAWRRWWMALPVAAAAALAVVALAPRSGGDGFQARSGPARPVEGLRAFCIGEDGPGSRILAAAAVGEAAELRCPAAGALQFSYTVGEAPLHLAIVSLPEQGEGALLSYTSGEGTLAVSAHALDEPLPYSTRLAARHAPGRRLLFALFFDAPQTAAQVEDAARALARGQRPPASLRRHLRTVLVVG